MKAPAGYLLLCDLKGSTELKVEDGSQAQAVIRAVVTRFNRRRSNKKPLIKLKLSYGDEIAGLFRVPETAYEVASELRDVLRPWTTLRFVVCYGQGGTDSTDISVVGGPVFKTANALMEELKRQQRFCSWRIQDATASVVLDSLVGMSNLLQTTMTDYQYSVFRLLADGLSQKAVADELGKFPQSVSEAKRGGNIELVLHAEAAILKLLRFAK